MRSVMSHQFSQVPRAQIERSTFDRSHGYKTSFDAGWLIPVFLDEALPGDSFSLSMTTFARLATPLHPIMDNMRMDAFFFFVPNRLVWDNWQRFCGEQDNPTDTTSYLVPTLTPPTGGYTEQSLEDYMGLPTKVDMGPHSVLWHRAYNLIFNQWFRDQNLQPSVNVPKDDGPDDPADYFLLRRGKRHDYFTSSLPFPQKGPSPTINIGGQAVVGTGSTDGFTGNHPPMRVRDSTTGNLVPVDQFAGVTGGGNFSYGAGAAGVLTASMYPANLYADLSTATGATITQLRQAFQIQRLYERDARGGTRYTEIVKSHFGVTSPDARLQRPEYLGGGSVSININPVVQTSNTAESPTPLGNLAAIGTSGMNGVGFSKSFTEHGVIIGLVSVRADLNYQQGCNRMFFRSSRFDFFWPALAHLSEQAVLSREIYMDGTQDDQLVWGYQERFAEYRYKPSIITGRFRSNSTVSLDAWHLAQDFATRPVLASTFIQETPPLDRIVAVPSEPKFLFDGYFKLKCARPMPVYGVPGMIDHF